MVDCNSLLSLAAAQHASDVHLAVGRQPAFRVHGDLVRVADPLTLQDMQQIVTQLVPEEQRSRIHSDGGLDFALTLAAVGRLRVNAYHQQGTPALAIRRLPPKPPTLQELQLPASLTNLVARKRGMVLVTGPTGSGKSTTLAALVNHLNHTERRHIVTLEDPIEFVHDSAASIVTQREIGRDVPDFAQGVRAALRQDPDVILVGEMRDPETIAQALQAAETGHLVLATLHSNDAAATVDRIINVFPHDQQQQARVQLASTLQGVVSQRLFKRVDGAGLVPAVELLVVNAAVQSLIFQGKTQQITSAMQTGVREGMRLMSQSVQDLYARQLISYADYQAWQGR